VGTNNIGYLPFELDVSSVLSYTGENTIVVVADNTFRVGALWQWGGIRRPVQLIASAKAYIDNQFITPSVDLNNHTAKVAVKVVCKNNGTAAENVRGEVVLSNIDGFKKSLPFAATVPSNSSKEIVVQTNLAANEVHLWNCDGPYLYQSTVSIGNDAEAITNRFGLRKIEIDNKNFTFKLNGESIRPMGFNLVPDDRTTGSTLPLWRVKQDVDLMKSLGANMARLTHLPLHKEMFDYLDEKGILVFSEIPLWGLDQLVDKNNPIPKQWLQRLITDNYNHPSIAGWSVGNEIGYSPGVMDYVEDAIDFVKRTDTSRLAVMISHTANKVVDPINFSQLGFINRYGLNIGMTADQIHNLHPDKVLFYSEYGYGQLKADLDGNVDAHGMVDSIRYKQYLIGGSLWTFNDYRSSFSGTKEFSENRPWGIVDVFRQKKEAWYSFRKEYAPIRDLKIDFPAGESASANLTIVPRKLLDLPAYKLTNYALTWEGYDDTKKIKQGGIIKLPEINPGDAAINKTIHWNRNVQLSNLKIELVSPLNYSVYDTTVYFKTPQPTSITFAYGGRTAANDTGGTNGLIRVVFERDEPAVHYKVKYGVDGLNEETPATLNSFVEIPKLTFGKTYQVAVVGVNAKGEGNPSEIKKVKVEPGLAPPMIYYVEPADKGFFVGYATTNNDYVFKVQYTTKSGDYSRATTVQSVTKGVMFVQGLINGRTYYFRMSRIKDNNYSTGWSEEYTAMPDGQQLPPKPIVQGVIRNEDEAMVVFEPVKKVICYIIQYRAKGADWKTIEINAAQINHCRIIGLNANDTYEFKMACINMYGQSGFTEVFALKPTVQ
jgi:beta-galactosidase